MYHRVFQMTTVFTALNRRYGPNSVSDRHGSERPRYGVADSPPSTGLDPCRNVTDFAPSFRRILRA